MPHDKRIDDYIARAPDFAKPILTHVRALVHKTIPGIDEDVKWGRPHFVHRSKNLAGMAAFKAHCAVMIHGDGRQGEAFDDYGKVGVLGDLPSDAELAAKLLAARDRIETTGTARPPAMRRVPKAPLAVPQDFAAALKADKAAQQVFNGFPPSAQREYVEWITEAKQDATREKRLKQAIEWIAEGKRRNWKYEKC
jgi:uncharacterized protein YdeI (YjbR/CyaY-like superfamily)